MSTDVYGPVPPTAAGPGTPRQTWDVVLSIVLLVLMLPFAGLAAFAGIFLAFASDSCGGTNVCDSGRLDSGVIIGVISPIVIAVITIVIAVVLLVKRRLAFWVPIAGSALIVLVWIGAALLVSSAVPGFTW